MSNTFTLKRAAALPVILVLACSLFATFSAISIPVAHADPSAPVVPPADPNAAPDAPDISSIDSPEEVLDVIQRITNWMFTIFIAVAAAMIIYAAYVYLTSGGGEDVSKAHKMILYSAIAIVVATASRGLVVLVRNFVK